MGLRLWVPQDFNHRGKVLKLLPPPSHSKRQQTRSCFCESALLACRNCRGTGFELKAHLWAGCDPFRTPQRQALAFCSPWLCPGVPGSPEGSFYMDLVPWFLWLLPRGFPLITRLWWPRGAYVLGSHRMIRIGERVLDRLPPPGHCTDSRVKHTPSFSGRADLLVLEGQAVVWHTPGASRSALREDRLVGAISAPSLCLIQLTGISQKGTHTVV